MPPSGSTPPTTTTTTTAAGVGPLGPGAGISTFASSTPSTQPVSFPSAPQRQFVISSSNSGAFSDGVDTTDLASLLQEADFQLKLAAFSIGGFAMYMPPIIVYPLQLFKTSDSSEFQELGVMLQVLLRVSGNAAQFVKQNGVQCG